MAVLLAPRRTQRMADWMAYRKVIEKLKAPRIEMG